MLNQIFRYGRNFPPWSFYREDVLRYWPWVRWEGDGGMYMQPRFLSIGKLGIFFTPTIIFAYAARAYSFGEDRRECDRRR